ncbi:MAG: PqqD family protein [Desulfobacterales bacterium]|nr:PqqD family protein [Desulfobacterales bacterium]
MKSRKKKPKETALSRAGALGCTPVKSGDAWETSRDPAQVTLAYPVGMRPWIARLVRRFGGDHDRTRTKKLRLDALGASVWDMLDGKRTVKQVIEKFARIHQLNFKEAEASVTTFLRELGRRGLIGMQ